MKKPSIYLDPEFAKYWNERAGEKGEVYKRYVLDPIMFKLIGSLKDKTILELGCGNGYLGPKFIEENPEKILMMDISKFNLENAAKKTQSKLVDFIQQDVTTPWGNILDESIDVIYSNMMLNEIDNIHTPIAEAWRTLNPDGLLVFSVTHPAWDLFVHAQERAGIKSVKIMGLGGYFRRGYARFIMGSRDPSSTHTKQTPRTYEVNHYQRPIQDYIDPLLKTGFTLRSFIEPELTENLLEEQPKFAEYKDNPIGLIILCSKDLHEN